MITPSLILEQCLKTHNPREGGQLSEFDATVELSGNAKGLQTAIVNLFHTKINCFLFINLLGLDWVWGTNCPWVMVW